MKSYKFLMTLFILYIFIACSKSGDSSNPSPPPPPPPPPPPKTDCILSTISQVNSGAGTESSLTATYNNNYQVTKIVVYDSIDNKKDFEADFNYINI